MKSKLVRRYYCEHCPKSGCGSSALRRHEERCFANPGRVCPLCRSAQLEQKPIGELVAAMQGGGLEAVKTLTTCPACIVSAIVQERKARGIVRLSDGDETDYVAYDYCRERDQFIADHANEDWP